MTRMVDADDLISSSEVAELIGVSRPMLSNWKERERTGKGLPPRLTRLVQPVASVAKGTRDLYLRSEVIAWWAEQNPALVRALRGEQ